MAEVVAIFHNLHFNLPILGSKPTSTKTDAKRRATVHIGPFCRQHPVLCSKQGADAAKRKSQRLKQVKWVCGNGKAAACLVQRSGYVSASRMPPATRCNKPLKPSRGRTKTSSPKVLTFHDLNAKGAMTAFTVPIRNRSSPSRSTAASSCPSSDGCVIATAGWPVSM